MNSVYSAFKNQRGLAPLFLVLSISLVTLLTVYSATQAIKNKDQQPPNPQTSTEPSASENPTPTPLAEISFGAKVFVDANENGKFDVDEKGIEGRSIMVDNQEFCKTDKNGECSKLGAVKIGQTYEVYHTPPKGYLNSSPVTVKVEAGKDFESVQVIYFGLKVDPTPTPTPKPSVAPKPSSAPTSGGSSGGGIQTERGNFRATVVTLPIGAQMVTDTASDSDCANDCPTLPLAEFVKRNGGYAGINGTYFCPPDYADCASKKNSFDFSVYNTRLSKWINQAQLSWNSRSIIYKDGGGYHYMQNANGFGGGLSAGVVNYPGILNGGQITVEASSLSEKQSSKGTKGGIGFNGSNIFLVIAYGVDMYDFAAVFKALGAQNALNLDGGGSSALYHNGYKVGPGRSLPNAIVFK